MCGEGRSTSCTPYLKIIYAEPTEVNIPVRTTTKTLHPTAPNSIPRCVPPSPYYSPYVQTKYNTAKRQQIAPYLTLLINGTGWGPSYPRLMTNEQLRVTLERTTEMGVRGWGRFGCIGDISCDIEVLFFPHFNCTSE
jgi:hypothetical protein